MDDHEHRFGAFELARLTGNPVRRCKEEGCRAVSMDSDGVEVEAAVPAI